MAAISSPETNVPTSVLIVDAESVERASLVQALRQRGYHVQVAATAPEALTRLERSACDLLVLDIAAPGLNGVDLMLRTRLMRRDLPIIVLTAQATLESAIAAVKVDVVDYMLKPCQTNDLLVTVSRALAERAEQQQRQRLLEMVGEAMSALRGLEPTPGGTIENHGANRMSLHLAEPGAASRAVELDTPAAATQALRVGTLVLDLAKRTLTWETDPPRMVELTEGEASILMALMEKPNEVFSYKQLAKTALGYEGMDKWTVESVIRSSVFRLRQKIEPGPNGSQLICTVRGRGYYFSPVAA